MVKVKKYYNSVELFCRVLLFLSMLPMIVSSSEGEDYSLYEKIFSSQEFHGIEFGKFKLSDLKTQTVIVNFWASWCIPCLKELPSLISLSSKYKLDELMIVAVNTDEEDQLKNIAKIQRKFNFPKSFIVVPDNKFKLADQFKFSAIPVTIVFKKGKVIFFKNGPVDFLNNIKI